MITLKGIQENLSITLSDGPWSQALAELAFALERARLSDFFPGTTVSLNPGNRVLSPLELEELAMVLQQHNLKLQWELPLEPSPPRESPQAPPPPPVSAPEIFPTPPACDKEQQLWVEASLVPRTLRSGQSVRYAGNVVVLGDIHAGAEVIAAGDVFVWGRLRGVVHAGASGEDRAVIGALVLAPTQLRIGNHIARAPDHPKKVVAGPEIARVVEGRIVIESWRVGKD